MSEVYYGCRALNGPAGSGESPEEFWPVLDSSRLAAPTTWALPIVACSPGDAWDKHALWHLVANRIRELQAQQSELSIGRLMKLAEAIITNPAPIRPPRD